MRKWRHAIGAAAALWLCAVQGQATPLDSTFTYQGFIELSGAPLTGTADLRFSLWDADAGGSQIGSTVTVSDVDVSNGLFTVPLDFGTDSFDGQQRWLEVEVRSPAGAGTFTLLSPRTAILATPYALQTRGLFVDAAMNVGIGTTSPLARLDVAGGDVVVSKLGVPQIRLDMEDPDGFATGPDLDLLLNGQTGMELTAVPEGYIGRSFNTSNGTLTSAFGTSNFEDGSGFINVRAPSNSLAMIQLWADADGSDNGISQGQIRVRSQGGGGGGEILIQDDAGLTTAQWLGGDAGESATASFFYPTTGNTTLILRGDFLGSGAGLYSYSEDGWEQCVIEPDFDGEGLFAAWGRVNGNTGLMYDGNRFGTGSPWLGILGDARDAIFDMSESGNSSVFLPNDAINALEILDEPGVASVNLLGPVASDGITAIASRSITVPKAGYVLVLATCEASRSHVNGTTSSATFGVSDSPSSMPTYQDFDWVISSGAPLGTYDIPVSVHGLFEVSSAGTYTYYFLIRNFTTTTYTINDVQFTLAYFPTAYGVVTPTLEGYPTPDNDNRMPRSAPISPRDIAIEQAQAVQFHQARLERELAEMQAQLAQMRAQLDAVLAQQAAARKPPPVQPASSNPSPGG